ncbi:siderophore ABC transporter substrate-binding protein [Microbacterium gorillae]|uniref:siderophore ABC transporter substrate-binding protein n=1 Tax=Microbacterium gorillae TaxID=1231063 RepID=UPI00058E6E17|nr:ABC transporter substrate-binding protein [Microbacterium gorillae]
MSARPSIRRPLVAGAALTALALLATGCAGSANAEPDAAATTDAPAATEVTFTDNHGEVTVPVNPERVVALDNTALQTLNDWDVTLVAAPKPVMGKVWPKYIDDEAVLNVGSHREPDLEKIVEAEPDLVIGGYRFASHYDEIKTLADPVIELDPRDGEAISAELKRQTTALGQIFAREDDAAALNSALDDAIAAAKKNYDGESTVIGLIASGGKLGFSAPGEGRGIGSLYTELKLVPGIDREIEGESADHKGDEIGVEAIAAANPEWLIVLDRDGAVASDTAEYVPAADIVAANEALKNVPAVKKNQIIYLNSNFYLTEGIQAYTELYQSLADAFAAAK